MSNEPIASGSVPASSAADAGAMDAPLVVRRTRSTGRLAPRPLNATADQEVLVQRDLLRRRSEVKPQTSRQREIAGDLPAWEPVPPGELFVQRPGAD